MTGETRKVRAIPITWLLLASVLFLPMALACNSVNMSDIEDTEWRLVLISYGPIVSGSVVTLEFHEDELYGNGGCNGYEGKYLVSSDRISVKDFRATDRTCPGPDAVMEQERRFFYNLSRAESIAVVDGYLELDGPSGHLAFELSESQ